LHGLDAPMQGPGLVQALVKVQAVVVGQQGRRLQFASDRTDGPDVDERSL